MRDEFSEPVKTLLAKRAGNRCSNPDCRQVTSGPSLSTSDAVNMGVAAHITAASRGGARYDPSLSADQRKSYENGIWLCKYCADLVDKDPVTYPVELLRSWKTVAEHRAGMELHRLAQPARSSLDQLQKDFDAECNDFIKQIKEDKFCNLRALEGVLGMIIVPEPLLLLDLAKWDNEIRGNLPPVGKGPYNCRPFGDGIVCAEPLYGEPHSVSVVQLFSSGKVKSASGKFMDTLKQRINDWAFTRITEYVYDYLRLLNKIGTADHYRIGVFILALPPCELLMSPRKPLPLGKKFRGRDMFPPSVIIRRSELDSNSTSIAVQLKPIMDHIWREFGFTRCYCYDGEGNWIGLK